jgi:hypothetical protein
MHHACEMMRMRMILSMSRYQLVQDLCLYLYMNEMEEWMDERTGLNPPPPRLAPTH